MGETTLVLLGALAVAGALLIGLGLYARARLPFALGAGILLGVIGAWVMGLLGIAVGVVAFALLLRLRSPVDRP